VSQCVPVAEAVDIDSLKSAAAKVSPEALTLVAQKAPWSPVAKTALVESLPECLAKWLNAAGISAEHREELTTAGALVAIAYGSFSLRQELRAMAAAKEERDRMEAEQRRKNPNGPQATN
jgi:hypothetical protein